MSTLNLVCGKMKGKEEILQEIANELRVPLLVSKRFLINFTILNLRRLIPCLGVYQ